MGGMEEDVYFDTLGGRVSGWDEGGCMSVCVCSLNL